MEISLAVGQTFIVMFHAGVLDMFALGYSCQSSHVEGLKTTLSDISAGMSVAQKLIRTVNGKVVYLTKTIDDTTHKVKWFIENLNDLDSDLNHCEKQLQSFRKNEKCHHA